MTYADEDLIERAAARLSYGSSIFSHDCDVTVLPAAANEREIRPPERNFIAKTAVCQLKRDGTIDWSGPRTSIMEEIRLIKRRLLMRAKAADPPEGRDSRLVMITSAKPGEGKTFTAANLALSIALEEDQSVLLIDGDIQRQSLRRNLGITASPGFIDLLMNPGLTLSDVVLDTDIQRLKILPAGAIHDRAPELLAGTRMRETIEDIKRQFSQEIIIFDSPPCLVNSDASTLASYVGQVLLLIEANRTQEHEVTAALRLLGECPSISLVLNKKESGRSASYGAYGAY